MASVDVKYARFGFGSLGVADGDVEKVAIYLPTLRDFAEFVENPDRGTVLASLRITIRRRVMTIDGLRIFDDLWVFPKRFFDGDDGVGAHEDVNWIGEPRLAVDAIKALLEEARAAQAEREQAERLREQARRRARSSAWEPAWGPQRDDRPPPPPRRPRPGVVANPHSELGVTAGCDYATARAAYIKLARDNHPDRGGDPERMKRINRAWDEVRRGLGR